MNNLHEYIGLIIAIIVVLIVIAAQIYSFLKTKKKISELEGLFEDVDNLSLKETSITSGILQISPHYRSSCRTYLPVIAMKMIAVMNIQICR